jgi:hypothetical protein
VGGRRSAVEDLGLIGRVKRNAAPCLVSLFLLLIGLAWVMSNPPGAGPDEAGHYVKAVGAGGGDLLGSPPRLTQAERRQALTELPGAGEAARELERFLRQSGTDAGRWAGRTAREFSVPAGLGFSAFGCGLGRPEVSASCLDQGHRSTRTSATDSFFGTYQPYLHVAPGLVMRTTDIPARAMRLGRLVNATVALGLIALAAFILWNGSRGALSLVGLTAALTPGVIFSAATLNPSGPEIASGICLAASLIRLVRSTDCPSWIWSAVAASGVILALSRSLGPLFVVLLVLAVAGLAGRSRVMAALQAAPRQAGAAAVVIGLAASAGLYWELRFQPRLGWDLGTILDGVGPSIGALPELAYQSVGVFGAIDTRLPVGAYVAWGLILGVLLTLAFAVSSARERRWLIGLAVGVVALTVWMSAVYRQTGFTLQGRHVLPVAVILPLWAGELLNRHGRRLSLRTSRALVLGVAVVAAGIHALAWYANGRRFAIGTDGGWLFISDAEWQPPLGWFPWVILVLAAAGSYSLAGMRAARASL